MSAGDLGQIREKIDKLDDKLVRLLNQRAELAVKIASIKAATGAPVYYPARERDILARVAEQNPGPLSTGALQAVFKEIFSATRSVEKSLKIACLGPAGSFSHLAAQKMFGAQPDCLLEQGIERVFKAVESGSADMGVVPIENSIEGAVGQTMDAFVNSPVKIHAEFFYRIRLNLLSREESLAGVKTIYTQYMPLGQCRGWLAKNLPGAKIVETSSSAEAAIRAAGEAGAAAIGAREAAQIYNLALLAENIEDRAGNQTRFLAISMDGAPRPGADKTSIVFATRHTAGSLYKVLSPFAERKINLSGIQSRPNPAREWEYVFFVDFSGSLDAAEVKAVMKKIEPYTIFLKPLGSYPAAPPAGR